jgi:hypothetical protein
LRETGVDLCAQPTLSRLENAPSLQDAIRLTCAFVDQWMASYESAAEAVVFDIKIVTFNLFVTFLNTVASKIVQNASRDMLIERDINNLPV